jgi:RNA polymerase sigma factor (sigma-70 family)
MSAVTERSHASPTAAEVRSFRDGDSAAAEVLARRACRLALRTAAAILQGREEAADVAQDVAVEVLRSLGKLRDPEAFDAWVHRITVRHVLRSLRRRQSARKAETPLTLLSEADHPPASDGSDRDTVLAARQMLFFALTRLPPKQRIALALRYVHDLPDAEIATALGCRTGTVHALLARGRAALRSDARLAEFALALSGG